MNDANSARIVFWGAIAFSCLLVMPLLAGLHQCWVTVRLYRRTPLAEALGTLRCTARTRNAWMILLPPVLTVIVFGIIAPVRGITYPNIFFLPIALIHLNILVTFAAPPSVLLLGSSRWESIRLFNLIERGIYPYRVVVLLEPSQTEPSRHSPHHWMHFEVDNLRILGPHSWRDVVHRISESVPIVVLDTRLASPAVIEETRRMLEEPFRRKTLFVTTNDGMIPSVMAARPGSSLSDLRTVRLCEIVGELKKMGLTKTTSPDDSPMLAKASYDHNSRKMEQRMMGVARAGIPFAAALDDAEREHGRTELVMAARNLQNRLNGKEGDGALEVFAQLSADIAETEDFIARWRSVTGREDDDLLARTIAVHHALCNLQQAVDYAPPSFLQRNDDTLRGIKG